MDRILQFNLYNTISKVEIKILNWPKILNDSLNFTENVDGNVNMSMNISRKIIETKYNSKKCI